MRPGRLAALAAAVLLTASGLLGACQPAPLLAPGLALGPGPAGAAAGPAATVHLRLAAPYALRAVASGYTAADVDHVALALLRDGAAVPGAALRIARADLARPVALRNLRAGTRYQVRAVAYADAAQATALSAPTAAAFTTPAVVTTGGVARIDDATIAVPLTVPLVARAVGLTLAFKVQAAGNVRNRATHVRLRLLAGGSLVSERVETIAGAQAAHTLSNLKLGTAYALVAQAILPGPPEEQLSDDAKSTFTFTTPAAGATSVETDLNVMLGVPSAAVPCSK